jgi:hypothetical protein
MRLLQGKSLEGTNLLSTEKGRNIQKMTLNTKGSKLLATASTLLGLWVSIHPVIANMAGKNGEPISMPQWRDARLNDGDLGAPTPGTKDKPAPGRSVRVDWNKVMSQVNAWIHMKPDEDTGDVLSRAGEEMKFFLGLFENAYGVHVVWEDAKNAYPDMTEKLSSYVHQVQAIRQMVGADQEAFQIAMQQLKQKIADETGVPQ